MYIEWRNEKAGRINRLIPPTYVPERMCQDLLLVWEADNVDPDHKAHIWN